MVIEIYVLLALAAIAFLSSLGALLTKDNFYSALYMALTMISIATIYAMADVQEVFVLIVFIFVGAIGIVTVALAAVYKFKPKTQLSKAWLIPSAVTAAVLGYVFYSNSEVVSLSKPDLALGSEYVTVIAALISLMILLMLSVMLVSRGDGVD
ncbi:hypothetical protein Asulf_01751 [Archaeoglobus sulfaticallidus PM70-1]|uniref:NADH:ubiquinone oxidoreductase subunit 6 (Chain J) n=1 Tax=Archaeoglobus sulfaticallidus PM70-1 TaxID=387631 RepID=N0BHC7_9EURY|nr:NADH-quinone oxidoreductase subunit J [Archaeoglobus sulfaticallidus]AGK61722.1 hypothetical protein Asulf_01751 [Archaeoglobus sulfaticallidus PM70-1]